jgi:hypothetical protein
VNSPKGFIVLCGSLELSSRNIVSGAVRLCYALVYSLFLGFGLAIGAEVYEKMTGLSIFAPEDYQCAQSHSDAPWFRKTPSHYWGEALFSLNHFSAELTTRQAFLTVPMFSLFLSLRNQAPWYRKELVGHEMFISRVEDSERGSRLFSWEFRVSAGLLITSSALDSQVKATSPLRLGTCYYPFVFGGCW